MQQIELIRQYIVNRSLPSLRSYVSCLPGNEEGVARLGHNDPEYRQRIARIVDCILRELGHANTTAGDDPNSQNFASVRRALRGKHGGLK